MGFGFVGQVHIGQCCSVGSIIHAYRAADSQIQRDMITSSTAFLNVDELSTPRRSSCFAFGLMFSY